MSSKSSFFLNLKDPILHATVLSFHQADTQENFVQKLCKIGLQKFLKSFNVCFS